MTNDQAAALLSDLLHEIAPEIDLTSIDLDAPLQSELDIDSVDFLNLLEAIYERTGLSIPETEYQELTSLNAFTTYLAAKVG